MSPRRFVGLVAAAAVLLGGILLLTAVHVSINSMDLSCGSALHPDSSGAITRASADPLTNELVALGDVQANGGSVADALALQSGAQQDANVREQIASGCSSNIGTRRIWSWSLVGIGAIVLLGVLAVRTDRADGAASRTS